MMGIVEGGVMLKFKKVIRKLKGGYIAVVDKKSPKPEKLKVVEFSQATKDILGREHPGVMGLSGKLMIPLIDACDWDESALIYPGPHKMHAFVLVLNSEIVGYAGIRWHWNICQGGRLLDATGKPFESPQKLQVMSGTEFMKAHFNDEPKPLEGWGVDAICILPEWQRQGLGKLLLRTALDYLGTNEREVAYTPPLFEPGKALIRSLGLNPEEVRLT